MKSCKECQYELRNGHALVCASFQHFKFPKKSGKIDKALQKPGVVKVELDPYLDLEEPNGRRYYTLNREDFVEDLKQLLTQGHGSGNWRRLIHLLIKKYE